ncbi:MAG: uL13 family ribosomal protein, partial [Clostridia bacterium]|nr:uL13 family ribosomal protein [Clostridia bacterium]
MKTTMEKAGQVQRKWYIIDATGKSVGRVAAQAASILRGK